MNKDLAAEKMRLRAKERELVLAGRDAAATRAEAKRLDFKLLAAARAEADERSVQQSLLHAQVEMSASVTVLEIETRHAAGLAQTEVADLPAIERSVGPIADGARVVAAAAIAVDEALAAEAVIQIECDTATSRIASLQAARTEIVEERRGGNERDDHGENLETIRADIEIIEEATPDLNLSIAAARRVVSDARFAHGTAVQDLKQTERQIEINLRVERAEALASALYSTISQLSVLSTAVGQKGRAPWVAPKALRDKISMDASTRHDIMLAERTWRTG